MPEIRKPAVRLAQGKHVLYFTTFTARDFIERENFYKVDRLDVYGGIGMQRLLNEKRAKALGRDLLAAGRQASLPTSVFLATEGDVDFDETLGEIVFDSSPQGGVCPLDVVDGQHRIEGLRAAAGSAGCATDLLDFPISAVVAPNMKESQRMLQFVVVNTKQEKVARGVTQHIIARFTKMYGTEPLPHIPQWLRREIEKGDDNRALTITKHLNADEDSPWCGLIKLADDNRPTSQFAVKQNTIADSIKRHLLTSSHMLGQITHDHKKQLAILKNYWSAVRELFVDADPCKSVAFKYNGLAFFLQVASPVLQLLSRGKTYTVGNFKECFVDIGSHLEHDAEMLTPEFWVSGSAASSLNMAAIKKYVQRFNEAVQSVAEERTRNLASSQQSGTIAPKTDA